MKIYYVKQETKRFQFLGVLLSEYLGLDLIVLSEKEIVSVVEKNDLVYFADNTMKESILNISNKCNLIGPYRDLAYKWNNKSYQANNLKDIVNVPSYKSYKTIVDAIKEFEYLKSEYKKFIIFENISDGGKRCHVCNEKTSPLEFFQKFRVVHPGFEVPGFRVSKFIHDVHNISLHFIIADVNKFWISPIIDQRIENEVVFRGGVYPSTISNSIKNKVIEETSKVAEVLSKDGYMGLCHIDFMIADGIVYFAEINPRKAGTTMCMSYMMENCFNYTIPVIEYHAIKEKRIVDVKQLKDDIPWTLELIPYVEIPKDNPGDERELFKLNKKGIIVYNEPHKNYSFRITIK